MRKLIEKFLFNLKVKWSILKKRIGTSINGNKKRMNDNKNYSDDIEQVSKAVSVNDQKNLRRKQVINMLWGILFIIALCFVLVKFKSPFGNSSSNSRTKIVKKEEEDSQFQLELASKSIKGEKKWQSYLEDKIDDEQKARNEQLKILQDSLDRKDNENKNAQESELQEIKTRLSFALNALDKLQRENSTIRDELAMLDQKEEIVEPAELAINHTYEEEEISPPESMYNYIPATAYVTGRILTGIQAKTLTESQSDPKPITIRLENRGSLPKDFIVDIAQCKIHGRGRGDLSSERVEIRVEQLVCEDRSTGTIITTDIAGSVFGDDGVEGVRGEVVSMAEKHLKNVFLASSLSGFTQTLKGSQDLSISAFGAVSTKRRGPQELAKDSLLGGSSTAVDMLADFNINLAKSIAPVIVVPGGVKVDISFSEGVRIGSRGVKKKFEKARNKGK
jgi:hypothetical protein